MKHSTLSEQETKNILNHIIKGYLEDKSRSESMTFDEIISSTSVDLGITKEQILFAFSHSSQSKMIRELETSQNQFIQNQKQLVTHLNKPFVFKNDLKFTPQEIKVIFEHAKENYLDNKEYKHRKFEDTIKGIADDLGLTPKQVRTALNTLDKETFYELELAHNQGVKAQLEAIEFIETINYPKIIKLLRLNFIWKLLTK